MSFIFKIISQELKFPINLLSLQAPSLSCVFCEKSFEQELLYFKNNIFSWHFFSSYHFYLVLSHSFFPSSLLMHSWYLYSDGIFVFLPTPIYTARLSPPSFSVWQLLWALYDLCYASQKIGFQLLVLYIRQIAKKWTEYMHDTDTV